jgi:hypothetical protein
MPKLKSYKTGKSSAMADLEENIGQTAAAEVELHDAFIDTLIRRVR